MVYVAQLDGLAHLDGRCQAGLEPDDGGVLNSVVGLATPLGPMTPTMQSLRGQRERQVLDQRASSNPYRRLLDSTTRFAHAAAGGALGSPRVKLRVFPLGGHLL